jgi:hypothetical protein
VRLSSFKYIVLNFKICGDNFTIMVMNILYNIIDARNIVNFFFEIKKKKVAQLIYERPDKSHYNFTMKANKTITP